MVFLIHIELRCTVNHTSDLPLLLSTTSYRKYKTSYPLILFCEFRGRFHNITSRTVVCTIRNFPLKFLQQILSLICGMWCCTVLLNDYISPLMISFLVTEVTFEISFRQKRRSGDYSSWPAANKIAKFLFRWKFEHMKRQEKCINIIWVYDEFNIVNLNFIGPCIILIVD